MTADRTNDVLAAIDGALADDEWPDAMRWSPEPETVTDAAQPFDGDHVTVGPEHGAFPPGVYTVRSDAYFPLHTATRGGARYGCTVQPVFVATDGTLDGPLAHFAVDAEGRIRPLVSVPRRHGHSDIVARMAALYRAAGIDVTEHRDWRQR